MNATPLHRHIADRKPSGTPAQPSPRMPSRNDLPAPPRARVLEILQALETLEFAGELPHLSLQAPSLGLSESGPLPRER